jgi:hypothetical protein
MEVIVASEGGVDSAAPTLRRHNLRASPGRCRQYGGEPWPHLSRMYPHVRRFYRPAGMARFVTNPGYRKKNPAEHSV